MVNFVSDPTVIRNPNPAVPLAALVHFETAVPVTTTIIIDDGRRTRTVVYDETYDTVAGLPLLGLAQSRDFAITVVVESGDGERADPVELTYRTPALPSDSLEMPDIQVVAAVPDRMEPGFTFMALWRAPAVRALWMTKKQFAFYRGWGMIACIDPDGEIVWSFHTDQQLQGMIQLENGNIFFHTEWFHSIEIDMLGNVVRQFHATGRPWGDIPDSVGIDASSMHHMPHRMANGNFLCLTANAREFENYYASETDPNERATAQVIGDTIVEFTPDGEVVWSWDTFDHLDPFRVGYNFTNYYWHVRGFADHMDWTHGNGVCHDPHDDTILVSLRHQCAVLKIDRKTSEIVWILGTHDGWSEEFHGKLLTPVGDDFEWHWHGHNPRVTGQGSFVMYDNRNLQAMPFDPPKAPADCFARAVEYEVDSEAMTVRQLWVSHDTPATQVNSWAMGDAHRLPVTDNMLVIDSTCDPVDEPITHTGAVSHADLTWNNQARDEFNTADFPAWVRIRELARNETADVLWEVHLTHPDEIIGWMVFGGFRAPSLYPRGVERT